MNGNRQGQGTMFYASTFSIPDLSLRDFDAIFDLCIELIFVVIDRWIHFSRRMDR